MLAFFDYLTILVLILNVLVLLGTFRYAPEYLTIVTSVIQIYISTIIIYNFNPFHEKKKFSEYDRKIIFSAGIYLLLTTVIGEYLLYYKNLIQDNVISTVVDFEKIF